MKRRNPEGWVNHSTTFWLRGGPYWREAAAPDVASFFISALAFLARGIRAVTTWWMARGEMVSDSPGLRRENFFFSLSLPLSSARHKWPLHTVLWPALIYSLYWEMSPVVSKHDVTGADLEYKCPSARLGHIHNYPIRMGKGPLNGSWLGFKFLSLKVETPR